MMIELQGAARDITLSAKSSTTANHQAETLKRSLVKRLRLVLAKRKQRSDLLKLDERLLKDIGKTREEAEKEANRYIWQ